MSRGIADTRFTLGEIVASGWDLYCLHFLRILPIFLIVYVPINIGLSFIPSDDWIKEHGNNQLAMYIRLVELAGLFVGILAPVALAKLIEESLYGRTVTWFQALRHAVSRWPAAVLTSLLATVIVLGLTLLLIVPGIIGAVCYSFSLFVVALRGLSGRRALDYSKTLVDGQWWRVFGYLLVIQSLGLLAQLTVNVPFRYLPKHRLLVILAYTVSDMVAPLFLVMMIVLFLNNDYLRTWVEAAGAPAGEDAADQPRAPES